MRKAKPFLRWAGGKTWFLKEVDQYLPKDFNKYFEVFLGGGSMFFYLKANDKIENGAILSDSNKELINAYRVVQKYPKELINELKKHKNTKKYYYKIREEQKTNALERASRFIFLNRTSFNGIYRENLKGEYNVPYGNKSYKKLFDYENIMLVSEALKGVDLICKDFELALEGIREDDFAFFDPPYTVAHSNNGFVKYNQKIFSWDDQKRLTLALKRLDQKEIKYILTNAYHKSVRDLYNNIGIQKKLQRYSVVGGKGASREKYSELMITNIKS